MPKIRTTKKVQTSIHSDDTHIIEFHYSYIRPVSGPYKMKVNVNAYKVLPDENSPENETLELIPTGGANRDLTPDQLSQLETAAKQRITSPETFDSAVDYYGLTPLLTDRKI